jgi:hypothetical protein
MAETAYRIHRNEHYSGNNDSAIRKIEGVYRSLEHLEEVVKQVGIFQIFNLPDGAMLLYDKDMAEGKIKADTSGKFAVATIELVQ